ncbi:MAG: glycosyltransferase family 4 protein [Bacteroidales bacterium]|jgi:glycosyltransferase involved in cell wall biosynthesis|nr:glycosyltransferase family 4 protein [Bacteroidales bacterium]
MIKVAHITTVHRREDIRIFAKECCSLAKEGYQVSLIVADGKGDSNVQGISIYDIGKFNNRWSRLLYSSSKAYSKALALNCDIYHLHDPELLSCCLRLKRHNKRIIFDSHEDIYANIKEKNYIPTIIKPFVSFIATTYQSYVLKRIDGVISVTPHICNRLKKLNPNTIMVTNYPIVKSNAEPKGENGQCSRNLIFAGGITNQWQHNIILDALTYCPDVRYTLCGTAYEDYLQILKAHANWNKVDYLGTLTKSEVEAIMAKSDIGLAILNYNRNVGGKIGSMGNTKLFEYMEAELPFICTDFELWKDIVEKYNCGLCVNPTDVKSLSAAINNLLSNPEMANNMGKNGRQAVEREYNWATQEEQLLKFYSTIINLS